MLILPWGLLALVAAPFLAYYGVAAIVAIKNPDALPKLKDLHPLRWLRRQM